MYYIFYNNLIISSALVSKVPNFLTLSTLNKNSFSLRLGVTLVSLLSSYTISTSSISNLLAQY